jgi:hypothetical protein
MTYAKPTVVGVAPAIETIHSIDHVKPVNLYPDQTSDPRQSDGAYEADE